MKFAATIFLGLMASATAGKVSTMLSTARKLNDQADYSFLMDYSLKLISCNANEKIRNPENGEYEYGAAIFRMCPEGCDSDSSKGCSSGYGDYVVGLSTFVQAYFEQERENMDFDDNFKVDEYTECRQFEVQDNGENNGEEAAVYYIGPACSDSGTDIKLAVFSDMYCSAQVDVSFEELSNGWELPYGTGGLVSTSCQSCTESNDNGETGLAQMCERLYEDAGKCETNMESSSYYGKQEGSCEYIMSIMPAQKSSGGGKVFGWVVFVLVVVGAFSAYAMWWKKSKSLHGALDHCVVRLW
jgi:hypothetical protein